MPAASPIEASAGICSGRPRPSELNSSVRPGGITRPSQANVSFSP